MIGVDDKDNLRYTCRTYEHAMGIAAAKGRLHLGTLNQIYHFRQSASQNELYDTVYIPRVSHVTGNLMIHDLALEASGELYFVNTLYNCIAKLSDGYSFQVHWKPDWISEMEPEDRCHLNGLCARDGKIRYISAVARTDSSQEWRNHRHDGGVIWDLLDNRPVAEGLSMPHSPRYQNGTLWFINSGTGFLCQLNPENGSLREIGFVPGFARGLAMSDSHAVIGTSIQRRARAFEGLRLNVTLKELGVPSVCALHVVNLKSGVIEHWLRFEGDVQELFDVAILPHRFCNILGFMNDDLNNAIDMAPAPD